MTGKRFIKIVIMVGLTLYVVTPLAILGLSRADYARVAKGKKPLFTLPGVGIADGGSVEYMGLGYLLYSRYRFSNAPKPNPEFRDTWAYDVGPEIHYIPIRRIWPWGSAILKDRQDLKLVRNEIYKDIQPTSAGDSSPRAARGSEPPEK